MPAQGLRSFLLPSSYVPEIAKGVAQFCLERRSVADGIIITGDLATTGTPSDISVAKSFVDEPARSGFLSDNRMPTLQSSTLPIYVFAGNHDRYENNKAAPNSVLFDLSFSKYQRPSTKYVGYWVSEKRGQRLGFVYADFSIRSRSDAEYLSPIFAYGQGRVYEDVLADLVEQTQAIWREEGRIPILWLIHFAPFPCGLHLKFIDYEKIVSAAKALGILATVCGHTHQAIKHEVDNHVIYCGGSACCVDSEEDCRIQIIDVEIDAHAHVSRRNFQWSAVSHQFEHLRND